MPDRVDRRRLLRAGIRTGIHAGLAGTVLSVPVRHASAAAIVAVRVWPAKDYTRVTLELDRPLRFNHVLLGAPNRLAVNLEGIDADGDIRKLVAKVKHDDPFIASVRVGQSVPGIVQLVFDLKKAIRPDLFALAPVARYRHRLVIDLHPVRAPDPLIALLNQQLASETSRQKPRHDPLAALINKADAPGKPNGRAPARIQAQRKPAVRRPAQRLKGTRAPIQRILTIAIDAGHGGEDPGALGRLGTYEKDIVLPIAAELRQLIRLEPGLRAFMTREGDYFVPLQQRVEKAQRVAADLFISIHADAAERNEAQGASVYVLSDKGATSNAASWLAARENQSDQIGGVKKKSIRNRQARRLLLELSAQRRSLASNELARHVLRQIKAISPMHKPNVERAGFVVLKTPDIPAILVETAFLSNPKDEKRLRSPHHQRQLARAIFDGLRSYLKLSPPTKDREA